MKNFLLIFCLSTLLVCTAGCGKTAPKGETKTYGLMNMEATLVAPPEPWVEKVQQVGENEADLGHAAGTSVGVTFTKPEDKGLIAVAVIAQQKQILKDDKGEPKKDKKGNTLFGDFIELTDDQDTLNQIALWVEKRDGERLKEEWITVLGGQAFHMIFEVGSGASKKKGEQVHLTRDGAHYTLSILVPEADYDAEVPHFRHVVESFKLSEKAKKPKAK